MAGDDQGDALKLLLQQVAALTAEVRAGRPAPPSKLTFGQLWEKRAKHVKKAAHYAMVPVLVHFADKQIGELRRGDWYAYIEMRKGQVSPRTERTPAIATLNQELVHTLAMLRWAVEQQIIDENPLEGTKRLKGQRPRETAVDPFELDEALKDASRLVITFLTVCMETGMRNASEARRLEWNDIDWGKSVIRIPAERTKTKKAREVPMSDYLRAALKAHPRVLGSPYVFANPETGTAYSKQRMWELTRPIMNKLEAAPGDGRVKVHDTRHGAVSRLVREGVPLLKSMKIVGHASASMHWRYDHLTDADHATAKAALDGHRRRGPQAAEDSSQEPSMSDGSRNPSRG